MPAVVSRGCGLQEAVLEGQTALLVESDDPDATASAISRLLSDDMLRGRMGEAARWHALRTGSWAKRIAVYDRVLRRAAGEL